MIAWLSPKMWMAAGLAILLAASHLSMYQGGKRVVREEWNKDIAQRTQLALKAEQEARAKEQKLQAERTELEKRHADEKRKAAAAAAGANAELDRLRNEIRAAAGRSICPNSPTAHGANAAAPFPELFGECAAALVDLGKEADRLKAIAGGLQDYAKNICRN